MGLARAILCVLLSGPAAQDAEPLPSPEQAPSATPPEVASATTRILVMPLEARGGVPPATAETLTGIITESIMRQPGVTVISTQELARLLEQERLRDVAGVSEVSQVASIAGRLNADEMVSGTIGRVGDSYVVQLTRVRRLDAQVVERARLQVGLSQEALLVGLTDQLAAQLFGGAPPVLPAAPAPMDPAAVAPENRATAPWRLASIASGAAAAGMGLLATGTLVFALASTGVGGGIMTYDALNGGASGIHAVPMTAAIASLVLLVASIGALPVGLLLIAAGGMLAAACGLAARQAVK